MQPVRNERPGVGRCERREGMTLLEVTFSLAVSATSAAFGLSAVAVSVIVAVSDPSGITRVPAPEPSLNDNACADDNVKSAPATAVLEPSSWKFTVTSPELAPRVKV